MQRAIADFPANDMPRSAISSGIDRKHRGSTRRRVVATQRGFERADRLISIIRSVMSTDTPGEGIGHAARPDYAPSARRRLQIIAGIFCGYGANHLSAPRLNRINCAGTNLNLRVGRSFRGGRLIERYEAHPR